MMDAPGAQQWFLRKHADGEIFGPLSFDQLERWASAAQIAPHDLVSTDQASWIKAPMMEELRMDWLVEVTSERYYGPTTIGAVQEFVRLGEIDENTFLINTCDGSRRPISTVPAALPLLSALSQTEELEFSGDQPAASGMSIALQDRIRDLEQSLREERRALAHAEQRCMELEQKCRELGG